MGRQRAKKNIEPRLKSKLQKRYKKGVKSRKQNLSKREKIGIYITKSSIPDLYGMYTDKNFETELR